MLSAWHRQLELVQWAAEHAHMPGVQLPDDWPSRARIGANKLLPLQHGEHAAGLSAIYSAVNAIRLVTSAHHVWAKRAEEELLAIGWAWRAVHGQPVPHRGMRRGDWARMVEALNFASARLHDQFVSLRQPWLERPPCRSDFFAGIECSIVARDVVLILLAGSNYSVVRGFTPTSLLLFDSGGRRWIKRSSITFTNTNTNDGARHVLASKATLMLRRSY